MFLKFVCLMRIIVRPMLFLAILWISVYSLSQSGGVDSTFSLYDSIQDNRLERIRQRTRFQLDQLREDQAELGDSIDFLLKHQDILGERLLRLESDHSELSAQYLRLREKVDQAAGASAAYRERLQRVLWLSGALMLLLILSLSLCLFLYSVRIRNFLQRQIGSVRAETGKAIQKMRKRQKKLEKRTGKDIKKRIKALKSKS